MKHANKQMQDTLMNYFLENFISRLLKDKMNLSSGRGVRQELQRNLNPFYPKYISLINNYEDKINEYNCSIDYERMLTEIIFDDESHLIKNDKWQTHTRKRILCLLLYVHWIFPE